MSVLVIPGSVCVCVCMVVGVEVEVVTERSAALPAHKLYIRMTLDKKNSK